MLLVAVIVLIGILIMIGEIPGLIKEKLWGELVTFLVLLSGGMGLALYLTLR